MQCGWGVMIGMDVVKAFSKRDAIKSGYGRSAYCKGFEKIHKVPKHLENNSDEDIIRYYGGLP